MSGNPPHRIVIVGGGISGLATALAIKDLASQHGIVPAPTVTVLETEQRVGGKVRTIEADGFTCEWGVNGFLNKEPRTLDLVQRLGLEDKLLPATDAFSNRFIFTRDKLRSVQMHPLKFLFSGILPLGDVWRLVRELWIPPRHAEEEGAPADESVADFARRRVGPGALRVLVDPMQTGIYAGDPEQMSVLSSFPRVVEVEQQYGGLIRGMMQIAKERKTAAAQQGDHPQDQQKALPGAGPSGHLTSFCGGMRVLVDRLAEELGHSVRPGVSVKGIQKGADGGYQVMADGLDRPLQADVVVLACPAHAAAGMLEDLSPPLARLQQQIPYSPLAVVCLGWPRERMPHPMNGFGFLVPRDEGMRMLGALWTSTIFPERTREGHVLLRVMMGGARDPEPLELDDAQLQDLVVQEVALAQGAQGKPDFVRIFRHEQAIPQYVLGHGDRLLQMEEHLERLPGLLITGNAYRGVSVNDCARNAWSVAQQALDYLEI